MNLAAFAVKYRTLSYFTIALVTLAGIASFFGLGQLEDPEFTIKTAVVSTVYPGASPEEVELEVTDRLEIAIQEMAEIDYLESYSRAGLSVIKVSIKAEYWSDRLPQIWDKLRRKVDDAKSSLPSGAREPAINDDFGDVFGFQLAVTGEGFSYADLEEYAKLIRKELSVVEGVARVDLWGVQDKALYLNVSQTQLSELGLSSASIEQTLSQQNSIVDAGNLDLQDRRLRIEPTGRFKSPQDLEGLFIQPSLVDTLSQADGEQSANVGSNLIRIRDIGTVRSGYRDPARQIMRFNGVPGIGISITNISGSNVVDVGENIDARLTELLETSVPIGIEVSRVHWQSDIVDGAVQSFLGSFGLAVLIVLIVLTVFMGVRTSIVIGTALIATIIASFPLMAMMGIDLQRMSLGALVIALGMMVDNAIVVADGFVVRVQRGMDRVKAAIEAASQPSLPLLGATVIAVMAFYPIFASTQDAGEYCRTLFLVVAISLLMSWLVSVTLTPLQCIDMLPVKTSDDGSDPYDGRFYGIFRSVLKGAIRMRVLTMAGMVALLVGAGASFGSVKQLFFPESSMEKFMIDVWYPEGTRIGETSDGIRDLESLLISDERVLNVTSYIGQGPPRFYLPVESENPYTSYAQLIVNVKDFRVIDDMTRELAPWVQENLPNALVPLRKFGVGPGHTFKLALRVSGPAEADPNILRGIAEEVRQTIDASPYAAYSRVDWRQRVKKIVPVYNQERGRLASIASEDISNATKRSYDGLQIGTYRERDDLIPIILRQTDAERQNVDGLFVLPVRSTLSTRSVPLAQVIDGIETQWEDPLIWRRDRRRTIKVQANPIQGETFPTLKADILPALAEVNLPTGYTMEWGAESEDTADSQASLIPGVVPAVAIMLLISVALFNSLLQPAVIFLTVPFALIGVVVGLLVTGTPFGFLALLGAMSLAGMMIKNAIVLLDEINLELERGVSRYDAVINAAVSRLRPVALTAATTVLGVIPLLSDVFWTGMAVTIMAGLTFGTVLTMIVVPVLYTFFFKVPADGNEGASRPEPAASGTSAQPA